ncbi:MAG: tryptophan synthase subunit alpha [Bacteroidota bacterium]
MNNRIITLFQQKPKEVLNIYCTAGYPHLEDTPTIIQALAHSGVDLIEIGMPFSDPIADGPTIQASNQQALNNGMTLERLFQQLKGIRDTVEIPMLLMGYINPVLQYGIERFCQDAADTGIDGLILPDVPIYEYEHFYKDLFEQYNLSNIFLISPQTSEERIRKIDELSNGFIYMVSTDSTTGKTGDISASQQAYFERIVGMNLKNPRLIGFGIHNHETYRTACRYSHGAIIGSAFIKAIKDTKDIEGTAREFVGNIRGG